MTWRWDILDIGLRVAIARSESPSDVLTTAARFIITSVTSVVGVILKPVDVVMRFIGKGLVGVVLGFFLLMAPDLLWMLVWLMLVNSRRLWFDRSWTRPVLILPGTLLAIVAHLYVTIAPDPHKVAAYASLPQEWPLTWHIWKPPPAYFEHPEAMYKPL